MKIKIIQSGWETYTGMLSTIEFERGISVYDVPKLEAQRISGCISIRTLDGQDPSEAAEYLALATGQAPPVIFEDPLPEVVEIIYDYTRESLEALADAKGIAGLRPIGAKYGVKSNSIVGLINELMDLTGEVRV